MDQIAVERLSLPGQIAGWAKYFLRAQTRYELHSPRLYALVEFMADPSRRYYSLARYRTLRHRLNINRSELPISTTPQGALSKVRQNIQVRRTLHMRCMSLRTAQDVYRLAIFHGAKRILHLGSGPGPDAVLLQQAGGQSGSVVAFEPNEDLARFSARFVEPYTRSVTFIGPDTGQLTDFLNSDDPDFDMVVVTPAGAKVALELDLFEKLQYKTTPDTAWVVCGVHAYRDAVRFWDLLRQNVPYGATFRCPRYGVWYASNSFPVAQHFTYIPWAFKPWRLGFRPRVEQ